MRGGRCGKGLSRSEFDVGSEVVASRGLRGERARRGSAWAAAVKPGGDARAALPRGTGGRLKFANRTFGAKRRKRLASSGGIVNAPVTASIFR